jgi:hypothetical protein
MRTHIQQTIKQCRRRGAAWVVEKLPYNYVIYTLSLYWYKSTNTDAPREAQAIERCLGGVPRGLLRNLHRVSLQILTPGSIQAPKP